MKKMTAAACAAMFAATSLTASAHQVWFEQSGKDVKLYFGEYAYNLREASPGLLDSFVGVPVVTRLAAGKKETIGALKTASAFDLTGRPRRGDALLAEPVYPISERQQRGATIRSLYSPAARLATDLTPQTPALTLDIVPVASKAADSVELQAFFRGEPLRNADVEVLVASGWKQQHKTDDDGKFTVSLPWRGSYVVLLNHRDETPGARGGESYDLANFATTLTLTRSGGLEAPPALPQMPPSPAN